MVTLSSTTLTEALWLIKAPYRRIRLLLLRRRSTCLRPFSRLRSYLEPSATVRTSYYALGKGFANSSTRLSSSFAISTCTSDLSFFYVHKSILTAKSSNSFGYKLPSSFPRDSGSYPPASSRTSSIYYPEYYSDSNPSASPASLFEPSPPFVSAASQVTPSGGWQSRDDVYGYGLSGYTSSKPTSSGSQWDLDQLCGGVMMPTMSAEPPSSFRICVEETSTVLNLVLHLIYGMCVRLETLLGPFKLGERRTPLTTFVFS